MNITKIKNPYSNTFTIFNPKIKPLSLLSVELLFSKFI